MMPTIKDIEGFKFFFFANEGTEPAHVHVKKGDAEAKYWLRPHKQAWASGFNPNELRKIDRILRKNGNEFADMFDSFGK